MSTQRSTKSSSTQFEIHKINSVEKNRHSDSPTPSILKTPTAIFVSTRSSSTKRLKFANGPVDLQSLKNGSRECSEIADSNPETPKLNGDDKIIVNENTVEVAVSPVKKMQVSPESWKAFLEYKKKYHDYPNETEKTDYTYSRLSKFRHKEIIPGFLIRPNLSRSSISSSRKSSIYIPSNESSLSDSYLSYDFKVHSSPNAELNYDSKSVDKVSKSKFGVSDSQSKYYLRSTSFGDSDVGEIDAKTLYYEKEYFSDSAPEKSVKKSVRSTLGKVDTASHLSSYTTKVRSLDLDDADIDEVDDNSVQNEKHYHSNVWSQPQSQSVSSYFGFATIFLYLTTLGTQMRDLFSKHILRRNDYSAEDSVRYAGVGGSGLSWTNEKPYMSPYYYDRYQDSQRSWYQMIVSYFYDRFYKISNLIMGNGTRYASYRYPQTSRKRKMWWLLIPLLILAGSFLGYIDFFSNPKAILNTMYKCLFFIPSFLYYTVMVFIPRLIFEFVPYFVLTVIPNFVLVTLPNLFWNAVYNFWEIVHFFASISIVNVWNTLLTTPSTLFYVTKNLAKAAGGFLLNAAGNLVLGGYSLTSNYLMLFYSYFCTHTFDLLSRLYFYVWYFFDIFYHAWQYILGIF